MKIIVSFLFLSLAAIVSGEKCTQSMKNWRAKLFCYYSKLEDVNSCKCTHVILPANSDVKSIENLRSNLNGVKILVTVHEFNEGFVDLLKKTKVDGLEIDLKKLTSKDDIADFISTARNKLGSDLYTAVSIPAKTELLAKYYDFKGLTKHVDSFILQTAFLGASNNVTFHPSRLSGLWDMQNADSVVDLVTGLGAPISKLVIAAPVQGFQFKLQDEKHTAPGSPALEIRSISREDLCKTMIASNWTLERDQDQAGPYIFRKNQWIAFDDPMSMDIKAKYARVRGLAGLALKDLSQDGGSDCGGLLLEAAYNGLSKQSRAPRGAVLQSLEREILTASPTSNNIQVSPYRITRIIDTEGKIHAVRQDTRTEFECSRQGYFVHPRSCNRFYRCVKFNQLSDEFNVFEFDCPAGLAFDSRVEVCVWPGSLSDGSACSGSSEIAPVPKERFVCPHEAGYYADPENCRWFFACLDHGQDVMTAYEFRCPFGLVFDQDRLVCEWPWLVPKCASGYASSGVLVEFHGGAYGTHGGVVGVNGVINAAGDDGPERSGYRLRGAYIKPTHGVVLENYNGLGVLQPVALGGLHGPISEPISKVYSSFGHGAGSEHGGNGAVLVDHRLNGGNIVDGHQNLGGNAGQGVLVGVHDGIGSGYANAGQGNVLVGVGSLGHQKIGGQGGLVGIGGEYEAGNANAGQDNILVGVGNSEYQKIGGQGGLVGVGGEYEAGNANADQANVLVGVGSLGHQKIGGQGGLVGIGGEYEAGNANVDQANLVVGHGSLGHQTIGGQGGLVGIGGEYEAGNANAGQANVLVGVGSLGHQKIGGQGGLVGFGGEYEAGHANADQANVLVGVGSLGHQKLGGQGGLVGIGGDYGAGHANADQANVLVGVGSLGHQKLGGQGNLVGIGGEYEAANANAGQDNVLVGVGSLGHQKLGGQEGLVKIGGEYEAANANAGQANVLVGVGSSDNLGHEVGSANIDYGVRHQTTAGRAGQGVLVGVHDGGYANAGHSNVLVGIDSSDNLGHNLGNANVDSRVIHHTTGGNAAQGVLVGVHDGGYADGGHSNVLVGIDSSDNLGHGLSSANIQHGSSYQNIANLGGAGQSVLVGVQNGIAQDNVLVGVDGSNSVGHRGGFIAGIDHEAASRGQLDSLNRSSIRFNAGLRNDAGKSINQVTYHGNLGSAGAEHSSGDSGYIEGQRILSTAQDGSQGVYRGSHRGSARYQGDGQLGDGQSSVTYHGNFGNAGNAEGHVQVANGFDQGGYTVNSPFDRASLVFGTKLRGSKIGGDGYYIRGGHDQNDGSDQVVIGEENLGIQDGAGKIAQSTVTYHGNTGSSSIGVHQDGANVGEGGSLQYNVDAGEDNLGGVTLLNNGGDSSSRSYQNFNSQHNSGKVNIVKGGFSAVGVYPNTYKQSTPSISTVTTSPISVTPIPVTASPIPVVTSVPIPTTHINDNLDVYNGNGVVANVPELQVKVETPSAAVIPNIQRTHTASTGAVLEVENGGYIYDKPAVAFVEGGDSKFVGDSGAKSFIHQSIEHRQPILTDVTPSVAVQPVSVNIPQHTGTTSYHIGETSIDHSQSSLDLDNQKVLLQPQLPIKQNVIASADISGHSYQNLGKSTIINKVTPSILVEQKIPQPTPTISSVHFGTALIDQPSPSIAVQPAVSTIRPVLIHDNIHQHIETVTPAVSVQPIKPVQFVENVTPSVLVQPHSGPIEISTVRPVTYSTKHESFDFGGAQNGGFVENVTPAIVPQSGASYFYQRNDFRKSTSVAPTLPSASFNFQSLPARGFEKHVDVVENVTPTPILVQQEVKRPISVVIGDNQSNFLSSVAKSRGFSKFGQHVEENIAVTPVVNIAQPVIAENLGFKYRGSAKYTPTIIEATTPHAIGHEAGVIGLNENVRVGGGNGFGTFAYDGFGLKTGNYEGHRERIGYHYPKPAVRFEEGPVNQDYDGLEPVREEPFVLKKAYVTGNKYKSVTAAPVFVTSTVKPTYQSTVQSVYNTIPSTTVKPANFYYYDNRLSSTPKPFEPKASIVPIVTVTTPRIAVTTPKAAIDYDFGTRSTVAPAIITESKPIFKYSFSSFDSQYAAPTPSAGPVINHVAPIVSTYQPVSIKSTTIRPVLDVAVPSRAYLPSHNVIENYQAPILNNRKLIQPSSQAIVKVNDFHPLLSAKLGAQCTCIADSVRFRNKPVKVSIDDGETVEEFVVKPNNDQPALLGFNEGESIKDAYIDPVPDYEPQKVVDITPLPEVTIGSTTFAPISKGPVIVRKRLRVRPVQSTTLAPVTKLADVFLTSTAIPNYHDVSQQVQAQNFDRYGPGGLRSKTEKLQGTIDCQRAGLFRHPTQCNKFYSCRWDCTKNKFTLHVFNCPVHLTFDDSLGACNWPSQGPACLGNTLLPSD